MNKYYLILFLFIPPVLFGQPTSNIEKKNNISFELQPYYTISKSSSQNHQPIQVDEIGIEDYNQLNFRINEHGLIIFQDGSWGYLFSNSMLNNSEVGGLTIAIDNQGNKYINDGHICGGIIPFVSKDKTPIESTDHFFKYYKSDTDDHLWGSLE